MFGDAIVPQSKRKTKKKKKISYKLYDVRQVGCCVMQ